MLPFRAIDCVSLALIAVLGPLAAARAAGESDVLPRYRLKVGQELKYQGKSEFKYDNGSLGASKRLHVLGRPRQRRRKLAA